MGNFCYQNVSDQPRYIPGKRGSQVLFRPGEFSTDEWFSRFVGPSMLTRVPVGLESPSPAPVKTPSRIPGEIQKETQFYTKRDGVYTCKLCEIFRTGSIKVLEAHLEEIHTIKPEEAPKTVTIPPVVKVVEDVKQEEIVIRNSTESFASPQEEVTVSTMPSVSPLPEEPLREATSEEVSSGIEEESQEVFRCEKCDKVYGSARGLSAHMTRAHGGE